MPPILCLEAGNTDGSSYPLGEDGEDYVRIALVENEERLRQAVRQIRRAFPVSG